MTLGKKKGDFLGEKVGEGEGRERGGGEVVASMFNDPHLSSVSQCVLTHLLMYLDSRRLLGLALGSGPPFSFYSCTFGKGGGKSIYCSWGEGDTAPPPH